MKFTSYKLVSRYKRKVAAVLLGTMVAELVMPLQAVALTSGPSQPEFQGFSPLATSSLVDPFTGDFSYNIPLLDIDGYPLNLVYRATSNVEEEGSWVGYGWNVNVGTLNRMVRGLPDDMNGGEIKSYQNIKTRVVNSTTLGVEASVGVSAGTQMNGVNVGANAGVTGNIGFSFDNDNYIGKGIGLSVGGGVYAGVNAGPNGASVGANANAGVTLSVNSNSGGSLSTYAGFSVGISDNSGYMSVGFGKSVDRTYNTISGWERPNIIGSLNLSHVTRETGRNFLSSISNSVPVVSAPYKYTTDGTGFKLKLGVDLGLLEGVGINVGTGVTVSQNTATTEYEPRNVHRGYGYMYAENAKRTDMLDFTRDNDGGINKDMPYMPPAMKTFDVFSSTAHNASSVFRADRNDFGTVRDPQVRFQSTDGDNEMHQVEIRVKFSLDCFIGASLKYENIRTLTEGQVASGGCADDEVLHRVSRGRDQNLFFKPCGHTTQADDGYLNQVNRYGIYGYNKSDSIRGGGVPKRLVNKEPIAVYTNRMIAELPRTVVQKELENYKKNVFPANLDTVKRPNILRSSGNDVEFSKIGAILNTNSAGHTYVYATPVTNHVKNEVAFRINGFAPGKYQERDGLMRFDGPDASQFNGRVRDKLYKSTLSPAYTTSFLLNAVLSPDYVDVKNDGVTDDDLGGYVKFNYSLTEDDYRWRAPYGDRDSNMALLSEGVKVTKFDDMGSYMIGSKQVWYAHSIESKNYVAEFYLSERADARDSRSNIMQSDHPYQLGAYVNNKQSFARLQKLDCIRYYSKHDRYLNGAAAVPLKTIYFDYDYNISSNVPNSDSSGKLRLVKVRVQHGAEPIAFAETYDLRYATGSSHSNPAYALGAKDAWGNYYPNNRNLPLPEFPYLDQSEGPGTNRAVKNVIASAFHLTSIGLPSGGKIDVEYEADDYAFVQDRRAMALTEVAGVGHSTALNPTDLNGLYDGSLNPYRYIYVKKPSGLSGGYKSFLLNGSNLMYFSFHIKIAGDRFSRFDQVKGYAEVEDIGDCPGQPYLWIRVKPTSLTGTTVQPSPMTNTAINMARAFATDQLYFQEEEISSGLNTHQGDRLRKAGLQLADALFGKNSVKELMKDYRAGHKFVKGKSYVKLALTAPKIGGGSRVSKLTFDDEWNKVSQNEDASVIGYNYIYKEASGLSSGVASYEPTLGGEENPLRSGSSYSLQNNPSKYPPYDPIELIKEDPAGESFLPAGAVGYSRVIIESIHKPYARSAQSRLVQEFYTAKDFPWISQFGAKSVTEVKNKEYPDPGVRDILLSFLGISNTLSSSKNSYDIRQNFLIETNDMHGKPKGTYNYRLLQKNGIQELVSSTQYEYHTNGATRLSNEVDVLQHTSFTNANVKCKEQVEPFPKANIGVARKTLGVDVDVCTDSREVVTTENRTMRNRGGGLTACLIPPKLKPNFVWTESIHKHTDYFKATITTKIVNRYGILARVRNVKEGAETVVENKYYDGITGDAVVQVVKDKYGDNLFTTTVPGYWTKTDLEPSYLDYPYHGTGHDALLPPTLMFGTAGGGILNGSGLVQSSFQTEEDLFHQGDELFVFAKTHINSSTAPQHAWHRLYVADVLVKKDHYGNADPLAYRYGNSPSPGAWYQVFVMPYKVGNLGGGELKAGDELREISSVVKYRSGRKNMLNLSAGSFVSLLNPFIHTDSLTFNCWRQGPGREIQDTTRIPSFLKPVIDAAASRYSGVTSIPNGAFNTITFNPVSLGILNQPYVDTTYMLAGSRGHQNGAAMQRGNGILPNWYYWMPARVDSTSSYRPRSPLMAHFSNSSMRPYTHAPGNAVWHYASRVTKSLPSLGPVEETNPLGIFSAIYLEPLTKQVLHVTANGKFGQTWVETFEDLRRVRSTETTGSLVFSPFRAAMTDSMLGTVHKVCSLTQTNLNTTSLVGSFKVVNDHSHSGVFSMYTHNGTVTVKATPKKYTGTTSYFMNLFDFNLDALTSQKYTYEVWVRGNGTTITPPSVDTGGGTVILSQASHAIDGWILCRGTLNVNDNSLVSFNFPAGQYYDDLRVFPVASNVKSYVYHPFKNYLMAILDENNNATFYEYNSRNQLVRLKKETEKGVITVTENIKNVVTKH